MTFHSIFFSTTPLFDFRCPPPLSRSLPPSSSPFLQTFGVALSRHNLSRSSQRRPCTFTLLLISIPSPIRLRPLSPAIYFVDQVRYEPRLWPKRNVNLDVVDCNFGSLRSPPHWGCARAIPQAFFVLCLLLPSKIMRNCTLDRTSPHWKQPL